MKVMSGIDLMIRKIANIVLQVCIVGSGNWGSAIARLVGYNAARLPDRFQKEVVAPNLENDCEMLKCSFVGGHVGV